MFTVPAILLVTVMMYIPFIMSGYYSLTEWNGFVISLLLAVALTQKFKFVNVFRGIFFIPHIMSMTIVGFIWKFIFTQGFARLYEMTGWSFWNESWLGSPDLHFIRWYLWESGRRWDFTLYCILRDCRRYRQMCRRRLLWTAQGKYSGFSK